MSYHAFGQGELPDAGDPGPLCSDPNQWKEGSTCSIELCKTGYFWNGESCSQALVDVEVDAPSFAQKVCLEAGLTWDPELGCVNTAPADTGTRLPQDLPADLPGGGGATPGGGGGFTPEPSPFDPGIVAASASGAKLPGWVWAVGAALAVVAVAVAVAPKGGEGR